MKGSAVAIENGGELDHLRKPYFLVFSISYIKGSTVGIEIGWETGSPFRKSTVSIKITVLLSCLHQTLEFLRLSL